MIELRNINFRYAGGTDAGGLVNIDLIIPDGQVILLCGQSGCGKTTLTRLVNGLIPNYYEGELSGEVLLDGKNISRLPLYETAKYVGSVFQNPRTQFFTVDSTSELAFGCENQGLPEEEIIQRVKSTAEQFDMDNLLGKNIFSLSGGEKQKIACASVSASNPPIIVLDEPSSNLDMSATKDLSRMIQIWKQQGKTVIIAEHRLYYLKELIDRVIYLKNGKIEKDYQMKNETGDGTATYYEVYPGIGVMYNDFHMEHCPSRKFEQNTHTFAIHHCREGRVEWEVSNGAYLYLASGDIMLDSSATENNHCSFPVSHYHGITVTISVPEAVEGLSDFLSMFSIDLAQIEQQFTLKTRPFIMHGNSVPDHVISELYQVPENIRLEYIRVKVLELLVTLRTVDPTILGVERPYFYKTQVEKVKAIMAFMTSEPERHFTMEELSEKFDISTSALKQCFKGVYGTAIYTYMRNYRMDLAASLLTQTDEPITVIAGKVGYTNTSKFSEAFKKVKGKTPLEYRKIKI